MISFKNFVKTVFPFNHKKHIVKETHKTYKNVHGNTVHHGVSKKTGGKITIISYGDSSNG